MAISRDWLRRPSIPAGADGYFDGRAGVEYGHQWLT